MTTPNTTKKPHPLQPSWTASTYDDRFNAIEGWMRGKRVLDVGAASGHKREDWLHARIASVAARAVGIDIDETGVAAARSRGYDVRVADASKVDLGERFDVVFAGELIEHLSNFDGFLESAYRHLEDNGHLVLTTPNAFCVSNFVYRFGFSVKVHHEHTCWFCEDTLATLLARRGFEVDHVDYVPHSTPGAVRRALAGSVRRLLPKRLAWRTLLVTATKRPAHS